MKEMGAIEHLTELRRRVVMMMMIVTISFVICYSFGHKISEFLLDPLRKSLSSGELGEIVYLGVADKVISQVQVALWSAIILSSPLWFYQIWQFIKPGLHFHEIKVIRPFMGVGFFLFCSGVAFGRFLVLPFVFAVLMTFGVDDVKAAISLKEYLVLSIKCLVLLGIMFQLPSAILILGLMGIATRKNLSRLRSYIYVLLALLSAFLTPPDPMTMVALWLPLVILFETGVLAVILVAEPYLKRKKALL